MATVPREYMHNSSKTKKKKCNNTAATTNVNKTYRNDKKINTHHIWV